MLTSSTQPDCLICLAVPISRQTVVITKYPSLICLTNSNLQEHVYFRGAEIND